MRYSLRLFVLGMLALTMLVLASCGSPAAPVPTSPAASAPAASKVGGNWRIQIAEEPPTMDPQKSAAAVTALIWRYIGDPLVAKDFKGEYVPGLASEWKVSADGLTWDFTLRPNVKFHDGTPLNAAAVVQTFKRALDPATKSPIAGSLLGPVASIEAKGDMGFSIKLKEPFASFLENLTDQGRLSALSPAALAGTDDIGRKPVSTGPWKFKEWVTADHITLVRNPDYNWAPNFAHQGAAYLEELTFRILPEASAATAAFEAGELDQLTVAPTDVKRLKAMNKFQFYSFLRKGVGLFMEFNVVKPPFDDANVRKAMNYAIDKDAILAITLEGLGQTAYGPLPPSIRGYWEGINAYAPHYDKAKAADLLDKAGWKLNSASGLREKDGKPFKFTLFMISPSEQHKSASQLVQSQLKEIGVSMDIQAFEFGTLLEKLKKGEQQAHFMGYTYTTPDIVDLWFHSKNIGTGLTLSQNKDPELDKLIEESQRTVDWEKRAVILTNIQKRIVDSALWVPIFTNDNYIALQGKGVDAKVHPDGYMILNDAYIRK